MYKTIFAAASALTMAVAAVPADAAVVTYAVSGSFADGRSLSGSFGLDDAGTSYYNQLRNVDLSISGLGTFIRSEGASYGGSAGFYSLYFSDSATFMSQLSLRFVAAHEGFRIVSIADQPLAVGTGYSGLDNEFVRLTSGTISSVPIAAVPEPATWAMMLVGFSMIGAIARYRRRATKISYA